MRRHVIMTLLDTEQSYVDALRTLIQVRSLPHTGAADTQTHINKERIPRPRQQTLPSHWSLSECGLTLIIMHAVRVIRLRLMLMHQTKLRNKDAASR